MNITACQHHLVSQLRAIQIDNSCNAGSCILYQRHQAIDGIAVLIHSQINCGGLIQCQRHCYLTVFGVVMLGIHSGGTDKGSLAIYKCHPHRTKQIQKALLICLCGSIEGIAATTALRGTGGALHLVWCHLGIVPDTVDAIVAGHNGYLLHFRRALNCCTWGRGELLFLVVLINIVVICILFLLVNLLLVLVAS